MYKEVDILKKFFFREFLVVIDANKNVYLFTRKEVFLMQVKNEKQVKVVLEWMHI